MAGNILSWLVVVVVAVFFGWLTVRAWKARRWFIKWPGVILSGLLTLLFGLVSAVALIGLVKVYAPSAGPVQDIHVAGTPEQVARGQHIANALCAECHSTDNSLPLVGGRDFSKAIPIPIGSIVSANLTPGGPLKDWSDGEILRVFREGINKDGHKLFLMSAIPVRHMSDEDAEAVIAYLRSQPAVPNQVQEPPDQLNLLAMLLVGQGMIPEQAPVTGPIVAPAKAATVEYGAYLLGFIGCRDCHGADLTGGAGGFAPKGPSLRVVKGWTQDQFMSTIRNGVDPSGHQLKDQMPWKTISRMDDVELTAIYAYLNSLK
jgi:mono/diheme cytochrome c family protein